MSANNGRFGFPKGATWLLFMKWIGNNEAGMTLHILLTWVIMSIHPYEQNFLLNFVPLTRLGWWNAKDLITKYSVGRLIITLRRVIHLITVEVLLNQILLVIISCWARGFLRYEKLIASWTESNVYCRGINEGIHLQCIWCLHYQSESYGEVLWEAWTRECHQGWLHAWKVLQN